MTTIDAITQATLTELDTDGRLISALRTTPTNQLDQAIPYSIVILDLPLGMDLLNLHPNVYADQDRDISYRVEEGGHQAAIITLHAEPKTKFEKDSVALAQNHIGAYAITNDMTIGLYIPEQGLQVYAPQRHS